MSEPNGARYRPRLHVRWPIKIIRNAGEAPIDAETEDVSSNGFSMRLANSFQVGDKFECQLYIPTFHPDFPRDRIVLNCHARVVDIRAIKGEDTVLINCHIEDYSVLSELPNAHNGGPSIQ